MLKFLLFAATTKIVHHNIVEFSRVNKTLVKIVVQALIASQMNVIKVHVLHKNALLGQIVRQIIVVILYVINVLKIMTALLDIIVALVTVLNHHVLIIQIVFQLMLVKITP